MRKISRRLGGGDGIADEPGRIADVFAREELDRDDGDGVGGCREDLVDALDRGDLGLDLLGDELLDVARRGAWVDGRDDDVRDLHFRVRFAREDAIGIGAPAGDEEDEEEQAYCSNCYADVDYEGDLCDDCRAEEEDEE